MSLCADEYMTAAAVEPGASEAKEPAAEDPAQDPYHVDMHHCPQSPAPTNTISQPASRSKARPATHAQQARAALLAEAADKPPPLTYAEDSRAEAECLKEPKTAKLRAWRRLGVGQPSVAGP